MLAFAGNIHAGCNNDAACNYIETDTDDLDCEFPGDPCDDGSAMTENDTLQGDCSCAGTDIFGCTDPTACNYNENAATDDGSCTVNDACGVCGGDDSTCSGCTDDGALNYDAAALVDDGSCITPSCADAPTTWAYCYEVNEQGVVAVFAEANAGDGVILEFNSGQVEAGWDVITIYDGPNDASPVLFSGDGDLTGLVVASTGATMAVAFDSDGTVSCGSGAQAAIDANLYCAAEVAPGCTDDTACNYDDTANFDDGTCAFPGDACDDGDANTGDDVFQADCGCAGEQLGCTDDTADNYDENAGIDDGSCIFNDFCSSAEVVTCGTTVSGSNIPASAGAELLAPDCGPAIEGPGVWYTITGTGDEITAETCGDPNFYDSRIHVYSGSCGAFVCEGGNDDSCGLQSSVTWFGAIGVDYYIHVSGWNGGVGAFDISFSCAPATCVPPLNDQCGNAFPLADGAVFAGTNVCSYANDPQPACDPFASINGVWYVWNSGANNAAVIDFATAAAPVDSAAVAPALAMFTGTCGSQLELFCDDVTLPLAGVEVVDLDLATDYYFLVWTDADESEGEFDLTVTGGVSGCTTEGACNYDATATIDDGNCDLSCVGCTDPAALNYSATATFDDGSCVYGCADGITATWNYCYDVNLNEVVALFIADAGELPTLVFNAGEIEAGWDVISIYDGEDNTAPLLFTGDGDLTGLIVQGTTEGGFLAVEIVSDGTVSCGSGAQVEIDASLYCTAEFIAGCTDPLATNYNPDANADCDGTLGGSEFNPCCEYFGCTDAAACNYDPLALDDDGSCCLDNCATITITDTFGDGGGSMTVFAEDGVTVLASVDLADGFEISEDFCFPDGCTTVVPTVDAFPDEIGMSITTQDGVVYELLPGGSTDSEVIDLGDTGNCTISGCTDDTALNYNEDANADCADVEGGTDLTCCVYPIENNDCSGAIALTPDVEEAWDTVGDATTGSSPSGYSCSPTLQNDAWYSFTPSCEMEVTITSTSLQGGEVAVWEGDCEGGALTEVACGPNAGLQATTLEVILQAGVTYYIQTGSNSDFSPTSTGTIVLSEGECRGCAYEAADNYDPIAVVDNGTCEFQDCSCPGDFNATGDITAADLTAFLSVFGQDCP